MRRVQLFSVISISVGLLFAVEALNPKPRVIYNGSASAPIGWYGAQENNIREGDYVLTWLPKKAQKLAIERAYLPPNVPLLKRVFALSGDHICVRNDTLFVNGSAVSQVQKYDSLGRELLAWNGCRDLKSHEYFLLQDHPNSFDSRYLGPVKRDLIVTKVFPLYVCEVQIVK